MLFSVVIPTYNRLELLEEALRSVWAQSLTDYEVIVIDDGSSDSTREWLAGQSALKVILQKNQGPATARNTGAAAAQGRYLAFLDSDDLWFPWTLATYAEVIARTAEPSLVSASLIQFAKREVLADVSPKIVRWDAWPDYLASHRQDCFVGAGMSVIRREAFLAVSGFDTSFENCEDHDLVLRLGGAKGFVRVVSPVTLAYRRHLDSMTISADRLQRGCLMLVERERKGLYPGARMHARQRQEIIARHVRPVAIACARESLIGKAWRLYIETAGWNLRLGRWKFLVGLPTIVIAHMVRRDLSRSIDLRMNCG